MDSLTSVNRAESIMQQRNWVEVVKEIGPGFAERSAQHDQEGSFVHENYDEMRRHKLFSARIPIELGGSNCGHKEMCETLFCRSSALRSEQGTTKKSRSKPKSS